jgi:L-threonylcarbamoyladenylate synthase
VPSRDDVVAAVEVLRAGGLVAFPTETVYGLGADATNAAAVRRLYAAKGRPAGHPVIVHVAHGAQLDALACDVPDWARRLAEEFWPGPLTLVVRRRAGAVCDEVTGGRDTVGVRVPNHPLALELLGRFGGGVAAPSANRFGRVSPTTAAHVRADLGGDVDVVLDGGPAAVGVESTIVAALGDEPIVLREGAVTERDVTRVTGRAVVRDGAGTDIAAPGTLASHYAPRAEVEIVDAAQLADRTAEHGTFVLALAEVAVPDRFERLPAPRDVEDYARALYARLREADSRGARTILVVAPPADGIGIAIRDRLTRAARATDL